MSTTPQDIVGNVFQSSSSSSSDIGAIIVLVVVALIFLLGIGIGIGFLMWYSQYKHKVVIFEVYSGGVRILQDRAKLIKTKGMTKLELLKSKAKVQPPPGYESKYFWGKHQAFMLHKENDMYRFHVEYNVDSNELKVLPQEVTEFIVKEIEENHKRYGVKEFWEEYGAIITSFGFSILVFGMMIILIQKFGDITGRIDGIVSKAGELLKHANGPSPP